MAVPPYRMSRPSSDAVSFTIEKFGVDRCLFESNYPVDKVSCSYAVLWNSFKRLTAVYSADEKAKLFDGTAQRVYRLTGPSSAGGN
jgi:L-fuconolactonase